MVYLGSCSSWIISEVAFVFLDSLLILQGCSLIWWWGHKRIGMLRSGFWSEHWPHFEISLFEYWPGFWACSNCPRASPRWLLRGKTAYLDLVFKLHRHWLFWVFDQIFPAAKLSNCHFGHSLHSTPSAGRNWFPATAHTWIKFVQEDTFIALYSEDTKRCHLCCVAFVQISPLNKNSKGK